MPGWDRVEWWRIAAAGNFRWGGISFAASSAAVMAYAAGKNAGVFGGAGICHTARHGALRTSGARRTWVSRGSVGIQVEGAAGGVKAVGGDQWSVVSKISVVLLAAEHWSLATC